MSRGWKAAFGVTGLVAVVLAGIVWLIALADADDPVRPGRMGSITRMEMSGEMHDMLEQHRQMLDRMEEDASPAMMQLMNADPMWQMMRSPEWSRMDEQHRDDVERMMGR